MRMIGIRQARDLLPEREGLVVVGIDRDQQLVLGRPNSLVIRVQACSIACSLK
jgi:hypothetical protein